MTAPTVPAEVVAVVPAEPSAVLLLRTTAASLAPAATGLDRLDDLALAVGEAALALIAAPGADRLTLTVSRHGKRLHIGVSVPGPSRSDWLERWRQSLSARILEAVVDDPDPWMDGGRWGISFRFSPD